MYTQKVVETIRSDNELSTFVQFSIEKVIGQDFWTIFESACFLTDCPKSHIHKIDINLKGECNKSFMLFPKKLFYLKNYSKNFQTFDSRDISYFLCQ